MTIKTDSSSWTSASAWLNWIGFTNKKEKRHYLINSNENPVFNKLRRASTQAIGLSIDSEAYIQTKELFVGHQIDASSNSPTISANTVSTNILLNKKTLQKNTTVASSHSSTHLAPSPTSISNKKTSNIVETAKSTEPLQNTNSSNTNSLPLTTSSSNLKVNHDKANHTKHLEEETQHDYLEVRCLRLRHLYARLLKTYAYRFWSLSPEQKKLITSSKDNNIPSKTPILKDSDIASKPLTLEEKINNLTKAISQLHAQNHELNKLTNNLQEQII